MHLDDPADASLCALCGQRWSDVDGGAGWLNLEVTRSDGRDTLDSFDEDFCSQAHAAEWLAQPLPPVEPAPVMPRTARSRFADVGLMALFAVPAVLACVGVFAIGNWLGLYG